MNKVRFVLSMVFASLVLAVYGGESGRRAEIDSLRALLPGKSGEERLNILFLIYEHSVGSDNLRDELDVLYPYLHEAQRQDNQTETGYALIQRLCTFYNYDQSDSLFHYYPETIEYFRRNRDWSKYYFAALLNVQEYVNTDHPLVAMNYAQQLYADATVGDNDYGRGAAAHMLGYVHHVQGNRAEAILYLNEAIRYLVNENDPTILFWAYSKLWETYYDEKRYGEALEILKKWETALHRNIRENEETEGFFSSQSELFYCMCGMSEVYSRMQMFPEAREYLAKAESLMVDRPIYTDFFNISKSTYFEETGDREAAALWFGKAIPANGEFHVVRDGFEKYERYAQLLVSAGRYREAAEMYEKALEYARRIKSVELETQLRDLQSAYELDRLNVRARNIQILAGIIIVSLMAIATTYLVYYFRLRNKNRALSEQLKEVSRLRSWQLTHLAEEKKGKSYAEDDIGHKKNEELVWLACKRMVEEKHFRNPSLNRKQLADLLGTNENYLAAAIRDVNGGQTVGDFINGFRLDYACQLITDSPHMTLETVAHESGLVTRSTLFRLFLKKFGMSPSQYRIEQIKERKSV